MVQDKDIATMDGRQIANYIWAIKWHDCCMTLSELEGYFRCLKHL